MGDEIKQIMMDWIHYLKSQKMYGNEDPLFPMNEIGLDEQRQFRSIGLKPEHWSTASPIRAIFKKSFQDVGLPYFKPHSFRHSLVQFGYIVCKKDIEALKSWSQNLGHESMMTTLYTYGEISTHRQEEILKNLNNQEPEITANSFAKEVAEILRARGATIG